MDNMLRKRLNKNSLPLNVTNDPITQRLSYVKEILKDSTFLPKTVEYKDIDEAFVEWVEKELKIEFEENILPTYALFSNQRYSEYMQMWETLDDNNNLKLNFKVITRENNPQNGELYSRTGNIPTETKYLMNRIEGLNDQGKPCYVEYRMTQPLPVDFKYKVTLITNKYELLNNFNMMVLNKFNSLQAYLFPNEHPMPMKLNGVSDESDYTVDDRQYFAQTYDILLRGYIISKDSFDIEIKPIVALRGIGGDTVKRKPQVEIEEFELINTCPKEEEEQYYHQPMKITITYMEKDSPSCEFTIDCNMAFNGIVCENVRTYLMKINDNIVNPEEGEIIVNDGDVIKLKITKINRLKTSTVFIDGYSPDIIYDVKDDVVESDLDFKNNPNEIEVE